jgi:hypothetical protein
MKRPLTPHIEAEIRRIALDAIAQGWTPELLWGLSLQDVVANLKWWPHSFLSITVTMTALAVKN